MKKTHMNGYKMINLYNLHKSINDAIMVKMMWLHVHSNIVVNAHVQCNNVIVATTCNNVIVHTQLQRMSRYYTYHTHNCVPITSIII